MANSTIEFSARVPEEDYDEFRNTFDDGKGRVMYGSTTWFISTALRYFNEEIKEGGGPLRETVRDAVKKMVDDSRK